jgi:hypothetical protein
MCPDVEERPTCLDSGASGVTGNLLSELHARGEPEFGVDVGEVGFHRAGRDEKSCGDIFVAQAFANQPYDVVLGRGERRPPAVRPLAFAAATLRVGDRLIG